MPRMKTMPWSDGADVFFGEKRLWGHPLKGLQYCNYRVSCVNSVYRVYCVHRVIPAQEKYPFSSPSIELLEQISYPSAEGKGRGLSSYSRRCGLDRLLPPWIPGVSSQNSREKM